MDIAFLLVPSAAYPKPEAVVAAAKAYGIALRSTSKTDPMTFEMDGGTLMVMMIDAPHPDVPHMAIGPTSPTVDEMKAAPAHCIVTALGLEGTPRERDTKMAALAGAIIRPTKAIAAMLGHGAIFHKGELYAEMAALGAEEGALPCEIAVDVTAALEDGERMSFLTHGMERYGREELFVTCPVRGKGALDFVFMMTRWLLTDLEKTLPTGDTVGRSAKEKILIQRVPNPTGKGPEVIRLDLAS
jgi:hypothetical protein